MGGKSAHKKGKAHKWSKEEAAQAGKKGGKVVSQDRHHMAEIGRKGGRKAHQLGTAHKWDEKEARKARNKAKRHGCKRKKDSG